ncbi:MAG: FMN-binding protein [Paludibacter sp.]|nr:FMN-binding protein [Paludibacter sp.]
MQKTFLLILLTISLVTTTHAKRNNVKPILYEVSNKDVVQCVFPEAEKVEKVNDYWYKIVDIKNKTVGYAMSSVPFCKDVIGYFNVTPVMIITNKKMMIQKVCILSNYETLSYVRKLENSGFFNSWNNAKLKDAIKIEPDGYTGATITAVAVKKNVDFLLQNGIKELPKK